MAPWALSLAVGRRLKWARPPAPGGAPSRAWAPPVPQHKAPNNPGFASVIGTGAGNFRRVHAEMDGRLQVDRRLEENHGVPRHAHAFARLAPQPARAAHRDALVDLQARRAGAGVRVGHERAG